MKNKRSENLKPFSSDQDRQKAAENGRKGGRKSGEIRRKKRELRAFLSDYLYRPASEDLQKRMAAYGVAERDRVNLMAMFIAVFARAMNGDVQCARQIMQWAGLDPETEIREKAELLRMEQAGQSAAGAVGHDNESDDVIIYNPAQAAELFRTASETGDVDQARKVLRMAGIKEDGTEAG